MKFELSETIASEVVKNEPLDETPQKASRLSDGSPDPPLQYEALRPMTVAI
jgi:hypothetical protein